jgi:myo-inositol-1(or 4)-monophosphatase
LGEEGHGAFSAEGLLFIIDPIDGTANFVRGLGQSAISVALAEDGRVKVGVVYNPYREEYYEAAEGLGARLNGKPISVSARDFSAGILCTAMSVYNKSLAKTCSDIIYDAYMECNDVRRFGGCALELCYLAAGRCDLYFEMRVFPWDYAAGYLILKEAGGELTGFGGEVLDFTKATALIGANRRDNYDKMRSLVEKHMTCIPYKE